MFAAWYEKNGPAAEVMKTGELPEPEPAAGEVRVRLHASAVNPSDVKARAGSRPIRWPKLIPNSDGAGVIDRIGTGVTTHKIGDRVWVFNGQWDRAFGTSAQFIVLPAALAVPLPASLNWEQGACLGIPVMTAHRCLFADGPLTGKSVLVTGGAGVVSGAAGRRISNIEPMPTRDCTRMCPPWWRMIERLVASPKPLPLDLVVK